MSSKNSANKKCASKSLDTFLNRKKTQKMQLRKMDRSMKAITQLLKSPNTSHLQAPPKKLPEKSPDIVHLQLSQNNLPEKKNKPGRLQVSPKKLQEKVLNTGQLQFMSKNTSGNISNHSLGKIILKKSPEKSSNNGCIVQIYSKNIQEKCFVTTPKKIIKKKSVAGQIQISPKNISEKEMNSSQLVAQKRFEEEFAKILHLKKKTTEKVSAQKQLTPKKVLKNSCEAKTDELPTSSDKKSSKIENVEYYPNKLKRNVSAKTILMKSNYNMKVVGGTNKRKLQTPKKGIISPSTGESLNGISKQIMLNSPNHPSNHSEFDTSEMVRLIEDTQSLGDEDFLEILTCPSPVWWEDPPDEGYFEDSIFTRRTISNNEQNIDILKSQTVMNSNIIDKQTCADDIKIVIKHTDKKFIEKQSKLENLLGTIKNRRCHTGQHVTIKNHQDKTKKNIDIKSRVKRNSDSTEGSIFSDISLSEDELLRDLENLDIPINSELNKMDDDYMMDSTDEAYKEKVENAKDKKPNLRLLRKLRSLEVPTKLPPLKRCPKEVVVKNYSPKSNKSSDDVSNSELDTISDTNIHFIDDDDDDECSINDDTKNNGQVNLELNGKQVFISDDNKLVTVSKDTESMNDFEDMMDKSEFITVFKIKSHNLIDLVDQVDETEKNLENNMEYCKIHEKRCKKNCKKRKQSHTTPKLINTSERGIHKYPSRSENSKAIKKCDICNFNEKRYVNIPDSTKKLCLYCSSIFDDVCTYCDKIKDSEKKICLCKCRVEKQLCRYMCNYCSYGSETKAIMRVHLYNNHEYQMQLNGLISNSYTCAV